MKKSDDRDPHVEVFGDTMARHHHHRDSGGSVTRVLFLFVGIMLLLNTVNAVPWTVWHTIWQFLPVLIIFIGLQIILGDSVLAGLVLFLLSVIVFGAVFIFSLQLIGSPLVSHMQLPPEITAFLDTMRRYIK